MVRTLSVDVSFASCSVRNVEYCHRSPVHFIVDSLSLLLTHGGRGETLVPPQTRGSISFCSRY